MRFPFAAKLFAVSGVAALLLLPIVLTQGKISERQSLNHQARNSIAESSAGPQRIVLPVIEHRCRETYAIEKTVKVGERDQVQKELRERDVGCGRTLAETLNVTGSIEAEKEPRRRGIFAARLYHAKLSIKGSIKLTEPDLSGPYQRRLIGTYFAIDVADARGIKNAPALTLGGQKIAFKPGARLPGLKQGIHADVTGARTPEPVDFSFDLEFLGMENLKLAPVSKQASVKLKSNWRHPSFAGNYLPDEKTIDQTGFDAAWRMSEFSTGGKPALDKWLDRESGSSDIAALEVRLFEPVNVYALSYRSAEYAFLFVGLTFVLVLVYELAGKARVHPVQYGFVGLALAVFFLLLLALAEHTGFARAYALAAGGCVSLITWYAIGILGGVRKGLSIGASSGALFGVLFMILQSEDYALLMGALLVFTVLAALMLATRRIDWYGLGERLKTAA